MAYTADRVYTVDMELRGLRGTRRTRGLRGSRMMKGADGSEVTEGVDRSGVATIF